MIRLLLTIPDLGGGGHRGVGQIRSIQKMNFLDVFSYQTW